MTKIQRKKSQNAQGMVEFALVLPILLLVILGVFAFGHLFYVYSSVVSASREAARWGAATGTAGGSAERFRDCDQIRAAAARVAPIAGIPLSDSPDENTPGVEITYDEGPGIAPKAACVANATAPDSEDINLGDRINVTVRVRYQPIVPLIPIPSFMLQANTARTIIRDMAVGEAPSAMPVRHVRLQVVPSPVKATVGVPVLFDIVATGSDQAPVGTITVTSGPGNTEPPCSLTLPASGTGYSRTVTCTQNYPAEGIHTLKATYTDTSSPKHFDDVVVSFQLVVNPPAGVDTKVTVSPDPGISAPNRPFTFTATVAPVSGGGKPAGRVEFHLMGEDTILCTATIDNNQGKATCTTLALDENHLGSNFMQADYYSSDSSQFHNSTGTFVFVIVKYETETILTASPNPSTSSAPVTFSVTVQPTDRSVTFKPTGTVTIAVDGMPDQTCTAELDPATGKGSCAIKLTRAGGNPVTATYNGDTGFKPSKATLTQTVKDTCPTLGSISFDASSKVPNSLQFTVSNRNGTSNVDVKEVDVTWAKLPVALLQQVRLDSDVNTDTCTSANCLWSSDTGLASLSPNSQQITSLKVNVTGINAGTQEIMLLAFNAALPRDAYKITVKFTNGCEATTSQTYQ